MNPGCDSRVQPFQFQHQTLKQGTQVFTGGTQYFLPAALSKCCSPGPCCFLDVPCSCKPPRLCSRCSHDLKGPSPALALILLTLTFSLQLTTQAHLSRLNPMLIFSKTLILIQGSVLFFFCSYQEPQTLQDRLEYCLKNTPSPPFPSSPLPL